MKNSTPKKRSYSKTSATDSPLINESPIKNSCAMRSGFYYSLNFLKTLNELPSNNKLTKFFLCRAIIIINISLVLDNIKSYKTKSVHS